MYLLNIHKFIIALFLIFILLSCDTNKNKMFDCNVDPALLSNIQNSTFTKQYSNYSISQKDLSVQNKNNLHITVRYYQDAVFINASPSNLYLKGHEIEENNRYILFHVTNGEFDQIFQIDKGKEQTLWYSTFNKLSNDWNPFEAFGSCATVKAY